MGTATPRQITGSISLRYVSSRLRHLEVELNQKNEEEGYSFVGNMTIVSVADERTMFSSRLSRVSSSKH